MHTSTTVQPGQRGAKKFLAQYGDRLVCVRYRSDAQRRKRFKTVELIVEEWPWTPPPPRRTDDSVVLVKVAFSERGLRRHVKEAGGVWNPDKQAWAPPQAVAAIDDLLGYLHHNQGRINDRSQRKAGYPLGSGGIESANKFICHVRLKRSGAWWYVANSNHMLALRCAKYKGTFERVFEQYRHKVLEQSQQKNVKK